MATENLIKAVVATAEVMGTELSPDGARMFCNDLSDYQEQAVMKALVRCRREVVGRLKLADVISRIDDGRPGVEEAWAMMPRTESETVVWTDEMRQAFGSASRMLECGEDVAARMAFKQSYERLVTEARASHVPVRWTASLGQDKSGREHVLAKAVELGRISATRAMVLLPHARFEEKITDVPMLEHSGEKRITALLGSIKKFQEREPAKAIPFNDVEFDRLVEDEKAKQ